MKVIDLLVKLANGEEVPKRFKVYPTFIYKYDYDDLRDEYTYLNDDTNKRLDDELLIMDILNNEVEIIEETPKEDKKIENKARFQYSEIPSWFDTKEVIRVVNNNFERHQQALNEIIDKINGE